jgi:hypothetical protein
MTQSEITAANHASALEQLEQDERNEQAKAYMQAEELMQGRPARRRYFPENTKEYFLKEIERTNVESSEEQINHYE